MRSSMDSSLSRPTSRPGVIPTGTANSTGMTLVELLAAVAVLVLLVVAVGPWMRDSLRIFTRKHDVWRDPRLAVTAEKLLSEPEQFGFSSLPSRGSLVTADGLITFERTISVNPKPSHAWWTFRCREARELRLVISDDPPDESKQSRPRRPQR